LPPNVVGALAPAVRPSFIDAFTAFRVAEGSALAHKPVANWLLGGIQISAFALDAVFRCNEVDFCLSLISSIFNWNFCQFSACSLLSGPEGQ
jgi:hypothetical protein